jgi:2-oxoglutarate ferredoxin oxidoreductase subunit beta
MLVPLRHGEPIRFGADGSKGVVLDPQRGARIVEVADVGEDALLVHDEARSDPGVAFILSRLAKGPHEPTPIGVFRAVERQEYGAAVNSQITQAEEAKGPGNLEALLRSGATWDVS